jgi:hypothetical protein
MPPESSEASPSMYEKLRLPPPPPPFQDMLNITRMACNVIHECHERGPVARAYIGDWAGEDFKAKGSWVETASKEDFKKVVIF